jgi:hypothetical protein
MPQERDASLFRGPIAVIFALALHSAHGGEDRSFDELGHSIAGELNHVLVRAGLCKTLVECTNNSRVLFASSGTGLNFEIYEVADAQAVGSAFEVLGRRGRELPAGKKLEAAFISHSKAAELKRSVLTNQPVHARVEVMGSASTVGR